jgi:small subunit ribosomal protein S15
MYNLKKVSIMYLTSEKKQELFKNHGIAKSEKDTGSPESQIALFTFRINHLTEHLKQNKKDYSTERALIMLVGKRRRLLDYLVKKDINRYRAIIKELGIRK